MGNPFLVRHTEFVKPTVQNKPTQAVDRQPVQKENKTNLYKYATVGLSLITLGTTAGMIYFARQNGKINKNLFKTLKGNNKSTTPVIKFSEPTTSSTPAITKSPTSTTEIPPKKNWTTTRTTDIETSPTQQKPTKKPVVQGIIRDISKELQEYLKTCQDRKINPEKVDKILTKAVGEANVTERPFKTTPLHPRGRVKQYTSPNGRVYVLETHESLSNNVTRLYMHDKDKHLRAYLFPDGTFRLNSFKSEEAHFITTSKGKRWMEKSRFLNNGARPARPTTPKE